MITATRNQPTQDTGQAPFRPATLRAVIARASDYLKEQGIDSWSLDARLIGAHFLGLDPVDVFKKPDLVIDVKKETALRPLLERRASGVPTAYITGEKEFWSLPIIVDKRVLIPRPDTEILVEESLSFARLFPEQVTILDIGTGSGAISIALAMELRDARVVSTDISRSALSVARKNVLAHGLGGRIALRHGDLFAAIQPNVRFNLIVSNPPYLTAEEMNNISPEVRSEPDRALRAGSDGLAVISRIIPGATDYLTPGGFLIVEIGIAHEDTVRRLIAQTDGLSFVRTRRDLSGYPRVIIAQRTT